MSKDNLQGILKWFFRCYIKGIFRQSYLFISICRDYIFLNHCYQMKKMKLNRLLNLLNLDSFTSTFPRHFTAIFRNTYITSSFSLKLCKSLLSISFHYQLICKAKVGFALIYTELKLIPYKESRLSISKFFFRFFFF